jgi:2-dehydro-3-deoxyphosphooctonate aldolase (KDO 8-P synthase)
MGPKRVTIAGIEVANDLPFAFIAGPCAIEGEDATLANARELKGICDSAGVPFIFKSSFDKANRLSAASFRGHGMEPGLTVLRRVREEVGVPVLTDVHETWQVEKVAEVADVLQIPAFLCRQTDLVLEVARTGRAVNVKKGQFLSPWDIGSILDKITSVGNENIIVTERGTTFGYQNLVVDFRSFHVLKEFGFPVCFDGTHSVQLPGAAGGASGGQREFVCPLTRSAVAQGIAAVFWEVHENPAAALSDPATQMPLSETEEKLRALKDLDGFIKRQVEHSGEPRVKSHE